MERCVCATQLIMIESSKDVNCPMQVLASVNLVTIDM